MADDAFSFYCKKEVWNRCDESNLIVVKTLVETFDAQGECTARIVIYKCAVCGGFYKRQYSATYYDAFQFDTDEGWSITDKYFKIEQPLWSGLGSTGAPPLSLEEARFYGYTGADHTWKNNRCNFNVQNVELTCRAIDLQFVAYRSPESKTHVSDRFYKCRRCGEWYFFKLLYPYTEALLKPSNELFPLEEAKQFGYDAAENLTKKESKSPAVFVEPWTETPPLDEWLKAERSEKEKAEYAFQILKKRFALGDLKFKEKEPPTSWSGFSWDLYLNTDSLVSSSGYELFLKRLFAELTDFCEAAFTEFFAYYLFVICEKFIDRDPPRSRFVPLLPAKALAKMDEMNEIMDRQHEDYIEQLNQSSY